MQTFLKKILPLLTVLILLAGCGKEDTPETAMLEIQTALAERNFEKLSARVDLEKFFAQVYDGATVELAKNYDYYKEKYYKDPYFQQDAEFLKNYNAEYRERYLKLLQGIQAAYFAKLPKPKTPHESPPAYIANEFEETRRAVNSEIKSVTINGDSAEMTLAVEGDATLRGQFTGNLIFKLNFVKTGEKWQLNKIENLDELTPLLVDKAEIVWINFF